MNKLVVLVSFILVLITLLVRSYHLPETFMFAEDEEDLSLRVKQIVIDRQPTLISAKFSATGLYLPPGYLYGLIPFFLLTDFHPQAAMIVVVVLSGLAALFIFLAGYYLGGLPTGFVAWALYAFWPVIHTWDRIFWNPNLILPASALVALALVKNSPVLAAIGSGLALQSHPQAVILTLFTFLYFHRRWPIVLSILFLSLSPLVLFELRHGFIISQGLLAQSHITFRLYYLLFIYPFIILGLSWLFTRHSLLFIFPILFLIVNLPQVFNQPARPDNLARKLTLVNSALDLIKSGQASPNIQINGNAAGFHYLIWYAARQRGYTETIAFHESWDQPPPGTVVIKP